MRISHSVVTEKHLQKQRVRETGKAWQAMGMCLVSMPILCSHLIEELGMLSKLWDCPELQDRVPEWGNDRSRLTRPLDQRLKVHIPLRECLMSKSYERA